MKLSILENILANLAPRSFVDRLFFPNTCGGKSCKKDERNAFQNGKNNLIILLPDFLLNLYNKFTFYHPVS